MGGLSGECSYCKKPIRRKGWFNPFVSPITDQCDRWWCRFRTGHLFRRWPRWFNKWVRPVLYSKVRFVFAWYDLWIGVYVDKKKRRVYVFPLPMIGFVVEWEERWRYWR